MRPRVFPAEDSLTAAPRDRASPRRFNEAAGIPRGRPPESMKGAALLRRGVFALFMGLFARGCVSPVLISGDSNQASAYPRLSGGQPSLETVPNTVGLSPSGALSSGHSRGVLVRFHGQGDRPVMAVTTGFQGRRFDVPEARTGVPASIPRARPRVQRPMLSSRMPKPSSPPTKPGR